MEASSATEFFDKTKKLDAFVAQRLNSLHQKKDNQVNAQRNEPPPFEVGSKVWYSPEKQPGTDKLDVKWRGPCLVTKREGVHSYEVEISTGVYQKAYRSQLKLHVADTYSTQPFPLFYVAGKAPELEVGTNEWLVDKILDHRVRQGVLEFKVRWKDFDESGDQWEPWVHFFPGVNEELVKYCRERGVPLDLAKITLPGPSLLPTS